MPMRACGQAARPVTTPTLPKQKCLNHARDKISATFSFRKQDEGVLETQTGTRYPRGEERERVRL